MFSSLPRGAVLNTYGEHPRNFLARLVHWQIRRYQRRKYPHSSRTNAIHSMLHLGEGKFLSVQHPRAMITEFLPVPNEEHSVWTYKYLADFGDASWAAFDQAVQEISGTPYDYGQLLDILIHQLFGWLPEKLNLFDFSRRRKVCSVAAHAVLVKAWQQTDRAHLRPLGEQYIEHTCPADFENHETFTLFSGGISTSPQ
jgi:hypothetical protein